MESLHGVKIPVSPSSARQGVHEGLQYVATPKIEDTLHVVVITISIS